MADKPAAPADTSSSESAPLQLPHVPNSFTRRLRRFHNHDDDNNHNRAAAAAANAANRNTP
ncbi:MAG: hypothetical protein K8I30_00335 [Anaerolineae bacterium]|nr:hypothetical protein [Anaerolineae bacterium]